MFNLKLHVSEHIIRGKIVMFELSFYLHDHEAHKPADLYEVDREFRRNHDTGDGRYEWGQWIHTIAQSAARMIKNPIEDETYTSAEVVDLLFEDCARQLTEELKERTLTPKMIEDFQYYYLPTVDLLKAHPAWSFEFSYW